MADVKIDFSFLKFFNHMKGIHRPEKEGFFDADYLETKCPKQTRESL
jgi:hypothetical protein